MKLINLKDKKFGDLRVIRREKNDRSKHVLWLCQCKCGESITLRSYDLRHGSRSACASCQPWVGSEFVVGLEIMGVELIRRLDHAGSSNWNWLCLCKCGVEFAAQNARFKQNKKNITCSQCKAEKTAETLQKNKRLGPKSNVRRPEYSAWVMAKKRCHNENDPAYIDYGARGIKMIKRWRDSFDEFLKDMGDKPVGYVLGRRNIDGDYSAKNCKWMTYKELNSKRRKPGSHPTRRTTGSVW